MTISGSQEETYTVIIELSEFQRPETMGLIMLSPSALAEGAGIAKRNIWTVAGPSDPLFRQNLIGMIERNYQRETQPGDSDPEDPDDVMRSLVDHFVEPVIDKLIEEKFPKDAVPVFRQFAREDFAFSIGLTIGQFWDRVNNGMYPSSDIRMQRF